MRLLSASLLSTCLAGAALAQSAPPVAPEAASCAAAADILRLTRTVIDRFGDLEGFASRSIGTDAAYLWMRYSDLTPEEEIALWQGLIDGPVRPPRLAEDMLRAVVIARRGVAEGLSMGTDDPLRALVSGWFSVQRAVIRTGGAETWYALMRQAIARDDLDEIYRQGMRFNPPPGYLTLDLPEAERRAIAASAEAAEFPVAAAMILLSLGDLAAVDALMARYPADESLALLFEGKAINTLPLAGWTLTDLPRPAAEDPEVVTARKDILTVYRATLRGPRFNWIAIYLNFSGNSALAATAAEAGLAALDQSGTAPASGLAEVWLAQYEVLAAADPDVGNVLRGFGITGVPTFTGGRTAHDAIAALMARRTAADWLSAGAAGDPMAPETFPDRFDWAPLAATLRAVRDGNATGLTDPDQRAFAAWVLLDAGRIAEAEALALTMDLPEALTTLSDFAEDLDTDCLAALFYPGMALTTGGMPVYDVPPR